MKMSKSMTSLLSTIVAAGMDGLYVKSHTDVDKLEDAKLIEVNRDAMNDQGDVPVRATEAGIAQVNGEASKPAASDEGFVIASGIELPKAARRAGNSTEQYPFAKLEVGQAFFVPVSEDKPNPAKSLGSTVASANARYAKEIEGQTRLNRKGKTVPATEQEREFVVRHVADGKIFGEKFAGVEGAGVWRVL